jgi:protein-disulfide isomerase
MLFGKNKSKTAPKKSSTSNSKDYVEINLPRFKFTDINVSTFWLILLVVFSFLLGMTYTRLTFLEKTQNTQDSGATQENTSANTIDDVKSWAKDIGLNTSQFNTCLDEEKFASNIDTDIQAALDAGAQATPTFFINGEMVVGALPYESFEEVIERKLQESTVGRTLFPKAYAQDVTTVSPTPVFVDVDNGHLPPLGKENAPVVIVEFSDFECPFCKRHFDEAHQEIKKNYIDTGKAVLYFRHLPLEFHPMAKTYAMASECANEQGKFWEMHDKIFNSQ